MVQHVVNILVVAVVAVAAMAAVVVEVAAMAAMAAVVAEVAVVAVVARMTLAMVAKMAAANARPQNRARPPCTYPWQPHIGVSHRLRSGIVTLACIETYFGTSSHVQ